ncbi:MAG: arginine N-succinyltransferase [Acetobacter sp.]|jgi:arginine N-succinyltransferase|nr:arginine N-succinyltransferase [Acetobacter sp.]
MNPVVRIATLRDLDALCHLASLSGGALLNLPTNRTALENRLAWSIKSLDAEITAPENELYMLVMEKPDSGEIIGVASIFSRIGVPWPFCSYKVVTQTHVSRELDRSYTTRLLHLVNDFDGASEVGGLFLHPEHRSGGLGSLLARSRYLFIANHRKRFSDRIIADLRGWHDKNGSPFWNAIGHHFFGRDFAEADHYNALHGNQFIADLMPRYPIYVDLLPQDARDAVGREHEEASPARRILEKEGFIFENYIDIFDGGPTLSARTNDLHTIRNSLQAELSNIPASPEASKALLASGSLLSFRAWHDHATIEDGKIRLSDQTPSGILSGATIRYIF